MTLAWWLLRLGLGAGVFLAGLDKFFNRMAEWGMYLSPVAERLLPVSGPTFMKVVGIVEMAVGPGHPRRPHATGRLRSGGLADRDRCEPGHHRDVLRPGRP